jgi:hypothetical protein
MLKDNPAGSSRTIINWVWLLWDDAPVAGMKALLVFFDVEGPVAIEVPA